MEIRVKVDAPDLAEAIRYLADALAGRAASGGFSAVQGGYAVERSAPCQSAPVFGAGGQALAPTACQNAQAVPVAQMAYAAPVLAPSQTASAPVAPVQAVPTPIAVNQSAPVAAVPVAATAYTLEQLSVAATALMDAGRMPALKELLAKYGVPAMTMLRAEAYGAFATDLRGLGAKI